MSNFDSGLQILDMAGVAPMIHGGHGDGGGLVAVLDHLLQVLTQDTVSAGWSFLGGIEVLGFNLHPLLLHFPIALLTVFFGLECYGLLFRKDAARRFASGVLYLGAAGAAITAVSGLAASEMVVHGAVVHAIMEWHERAGITVAILSGMLAVWRAVSGVPASAMAKALSFLLTLVMTISLLLGADLGGMMVYKHGVAVQSLQDATDPHQHHGGTQGQPGITPR